MVDPVRSHAKRDLDKIHVHAEKEDYETRKRPKNYRPEPETCHSLDVDPAQRLEELRDREILNGGVTRKELKEIQKLEDMLVKHHNHILDNHYGSSRREKEQEMYQALINLKMQQMDNLQNDTWRELKIDLLETEIGELVAWRTNYHIGQREHSKILDD